MEESIRLLKNKPLLVNLDTIKYLDKTLSLNDFLVLIYLDNSRVDSFDVEKIASDLGLTNQEVMESCNQLLKRKLITMETGKDKNGKMEEKINLDSMYQNTILSMSDETKKKEEATIYTEFEKALGTLKPTDFELINGWLSVGMSEELILGALEEATYNGAKNFRYIDKILYEWTKEGYKTMQDVENSRKKEELPEEDFFDYDWLNDDE